MCSVTEGECLKYSDNYITKENQIFKKIIQLSECGR